MKERKLNYRFHNPNSAAVTADYILDVFIESNKDKVDEMVRNAALINEKCDDTYDFCEKQLA